MVVRRRRTSLARRRRRSTRTRSSFRAGKRRSSFRRIRFSRGRFRSGFRRGSRRFGRRRFAGRRRRFTRRFRGMKYHVAHQKYVVSLHGERQFATTTGDRDIVYYPMFYAQDTFGMYSTTLTYDYFNPANHRVESQSFGFPNLFIVGYPVSRPMITVTTVGGVGRIYPMLPPVPDTIPINVPELPYYGCMFNAQCSISLNQFPQMRLYRRFRLLGATITIERIATTLVIQTPYVIYINRSPDNGFACLSDMVGDRRTFTRRLRPGRKLRISFPALISPRNIEWAEYFRAAMIPDAVDTNPSNLVAPAWNVSRHSEMSGRWRRYPWRDCARYGETGSDRFVLPTLPDAGGVAGSGFVMGEVVSKLLSISGPTICITTPFRPTAASATEGDYAVPRFVPPSGSTGGQVMDGRDLFVHYSVRVAFSQSYSAPLARFPDDNYMALVNPLHPIPGRAMTLERAAIGIGRVNI